MVGSLRALLSGVIDYAGLFPPAQLSLDQSIRNYARYRSEPENWMLGRFVCPVQRLAELETYREELFQSGAPFGFSALGRGGTSEEVLLHGLLQDLADIAAFEQHLVGRGSVDIIELRIVDVLPFPWRQLVQDRIAKWQTERLMPYIETWLDSDWHESIKLNMAQLSGPIPSTAARHKPPARTCGYKLRCGGLNASAFPSPEQVAFTIVVARDCGVPLKFTAGLHHPIRHFDDELQTYMHGFINVFGAGVLAHIRELDEKQICAILEDQDSQSFVFEENGFHWKEWHATTGEIVAARRNIVSFGSCSFDEPRDDLRKLGWLD